MKTIIETLRDRLAEITRRISIVKNAPKPTQRDFLIDSGHLHALIDEQVFLTRLIEELEK